MNLDPTMINLLILLGGTIIGWQSAAFRVGGKYNQINNDIITLKEWKEKTAVKDDIKKLQDRQNALEIDFDQRFAKIEGLFILAENGEPRILTVTAHIGLCNAQQQRWDGVVKATEKLDEKMDIVMSAITRLEERRMKPTGSVLDRGQNEPI